MEDKVKITQKQTSNNRCLKNIRLLYQIQSFSHGLRHWREMGQYNMVIVPFRLVRSSGQSALTMVSSFRIHETFREKEDQGKGRSQCWEKGKWFQENSRGLGKTLLLFFRTGEKAAGKGLLHVELFQPRELRERTMQRTNGRVPEGNGWGSGWRSCWDPRNTGLRRVGLCNHLNPRQEMTGQWGQDWEAQTLRSWGKRHSIHSLLPRACTVWVLVLSP